MVVKPARDRKGTEIAEKDEDLRIAKSIEPAPDQKHDQDREGQAAERHKEGRDPEQRMAVEGCERIVVIAETGGRYGGEGMHDGIEMAHAGDRGTD